MNERYTYIIQKADEENHIRELLKRRLNFSSRLLRQIKKDDHCVFLDDQPIRLCDKGKAGQRISVRMPQEISGFEPEPIPIKVIYEDEDILVVNKQPGFVVHPTKGHPCHTLANGIMDRMLKGGESYKIRFVNRLDMDTSGILLVGKNSHAQDNLAKQMKEDLVEKRYLAVVRGLVESDRGVINLPIGKPVEDQLRRSVIPEGYPSVTHYEVKERFAKGYSLVELRLETGRTHQIRVHMEHLGHPVVGDVLYGEPQVWLIERQALHAAELSFHHPASGERVTFRASLPEDMEELLKKLR